MLYKSININLDKPELICFVGAGGKTTTMFKLAQEMKALGKKVLVTTTTAIYYPSEKDFDNRIIADEKDILKLATQDAESEKITVVGREVSLENKLLGLSPLVVDRIYTKEIYDVILVEADGSKRKPIKAPNHHEPVIPKGTTRVVGVIGLDALGKEINEMTVHRPHLFCKVTNSIMGELIDTSKVVALTTHREGLFKNTPTNSRRYLLLNKSEDPEKQQKALEIIDAVKKTKNIDGFIVGNMKDNKAFITWSEDN